ncbi:protein kintoun [Rhea pennata]|uniref:protein kintoun n=1 Tax=Rhea pennata TaxID=8795 RepID=UPI002E26F600
MAGAERLEDLDLSAEEVKRLQEAFRDERFRELLADYAAELADPEQRRLYEEEVTALERERGVEVRFIHPTAGYVLRTSQAGTRRCYLNVCSNPHLGRPQPRAAPGGLHWALPYCLAPGREELGRGGGRRLIYDVVFHPEALRLAARSARFRRLLSDTALEAVERRFAVQLDRANATVLRGAKYKGAPQAPVIRSPLPGGPPPPPPGDHGDSPLPPFPYPCPAAPPPAPPAPPATAAAAARPASPTTPRWSLRQRCYVDLQDYRCCRDAAPSPVPRELVLTVELPLLRSAAQAALEVRGRQLRLDSQRPAYRLRLRLPYAVDESRGRAAFNKAKRQLLVTLPVVPPPAAEERRGEAEPAAAEAEEPPAGAEAGGGAAPPAAPGPGSAAPATCGRPEPPQRPAAPPEPGGSGGDPPPGPPGSEALPTAPADMALAPGCAAGSPGAALCPPFQCHQDEASITLLLLVPDILPQSLSGDLGANHYHLRFSSHSGSYALFLQFPPENRLASPETSIDVSAHNAVITFAKAPSSTGPWEKLCFGLDASALQERLFVSEENVNGFLDTVLCPSFCKQSLLEGQPLIEVLDVTKDKSQIRLQPQEAAHSERGEKEQAVNSPGRDRAEKTNGTDLQKTTESNCTAADTTEEQRATETSTTSTSFVPAETIGKVGCSSHHCSQLEPSDTSLAILEKSKGNEPDLDCAFTTAETAVTAGSEQAGLRSEGQAEAEGGEAAARAEPAHAEQRSSGCGPAPPVLREVNARDGSVQVIGDHTTHCAVTFQNSLLYELD